MFTVSFITEFILPATLNFIKIVKLKDHTNYSLTVIVPKTENLFLKTVIIVNVKFLPKL